MGAEEGLEPGRGRAEHHRRAAEPTELEGGLDGVVAGDPVLLVGGRVLLVDHDHAEIAERREDRAARADDDVRLAVADAAPGRGPLGRGEPRVHERHPAGEARGEAADGLRGEADLRDEDDRPPAGGEGGGDGDEVDLGLARAGHPVEEEAVVAALGDRPEQGRDRRLLPGGERMRDLRRARLGGGERPPRGGARPPLAPLGPGGADPGGEHRLDHLAERRPVAGRHPARQLDEVGEQGRRLVEHLEDRPGRVDVAVGDPFEDVADHLPLAEGHPYPRPRNRRLGVLGADRIGEGVPGEDGAELGHDRRVAGGLGHGGILTANMGSASLNLRFALPTSPR